MIVPMGWFGWVRIGALQTDAITLGETQPSVGGKIWQVSTQHKNYCLASGFKIIMVLFISPVHCSFYYGKVTEQSTIHTESQCKGYIRFLEQFMACQLPIKK